MEFLKQLEDEVYLQEAEEAEMELSPEQEAKAKKIKDKIEKEVGEMTPTQKAINTVASIFKKAGKKVSTRTARNLVANMYAGPFENKTQAMDILFNAGFRLTRTGDKYHTVIRRGNILVVMYGVMKNKTLDAYGVYALDRKDVDRKDAEDAEHGASYKGIGFKKWED